jgi:hypothetical protein
LNRELRRNIVLIKSILWRGIHMPGHEACQLSSQNAQWHLAGSATFSHLRQPCRLDYMLVCDAGWNTLSGRTSGWVGDAAVEIEIAVDSERNWRLNGVECSAVAGCLDLDLNFSPSTNLLPIRRLGLAIGEQAEVNAAWLRFPSFNLEPLHQVYRRVDASTYRYESAGGSFVADLQVDTNGFVTSYPGIWEAEAST